MVYFNGDDEFVTYDNIKQADLETTIFILETIFPDFYIIPFELQYEWMHIMGDHWVIENDYKLKGVRK
jgi:hypothetical protein